MTKESFAGNQCDKCKELKLKLHFWAGLWLCTNCYTIEAKRPPMPTTTTIEFNTQKPPGYEAHAYNGYCDFCHYLCSVLTEYSGAYYCFVCYERITGKKPNLDDVSNYLDGPVPFTKAEIVLEVEEPPSPDKVFKQKIW
jgi:hypothetical protein